MENYNALKDMQSEKMYNVNIETKTPTLEPIQTGKVEKLKFSSSEDAMEYASINDLKYAFPVGVTEY